MSNIAISEIQTSVSKFNDNDLLLISKESSNNYTSAKATYNCLSKNFMIHNDMIRYTNEYTLTSSEPTKEFEIDDDCYVTVDVHSPSITEGKTSASIRYDVKYFEPSLNDYSWNSLFYRIIKSDDISFMNTCEHIGFFKKGTICRVSSGNLDSINIRIEKFK